MPRKKKERIPIPVELAADVQFRADRTCCVCRVKGKPIQIHHIDEDPGNNTFGNLAVLCLDCHNETQIVGGFGRKLDADQIILYRDAWLVEVASRRASKGVSVNPPLYDRQIDLEVATSVAEIYREREEYELLAIHYNALGNKELRDKYIELAITKGASEGSLIFLRAMQERLDLVPREVIDRRIELMEAHNDWSQLGRLYRDIGKHRECVRVTCQGIAEAINEGRVFSAAFYLKELVEEGAVEELFKIALKEAHEEGDLWWQCRALQELGWQSELREFLLLHKQKIEAESNPFLLLELSAALGDRERYISMEKSLAKATYAHPNWIGTAPVDAGYPEESPQV
jgi:hypothetical protein